ncbi:MAG: FAD-binding oxidoreductase, partial [Selenomonadaceae bacterium]|nr:FAD-binding oxidoreductase [Selenomonadaceae bacterium]
MEKTQLIEAMERIVGKEHVLHSPEALYEYSYDATPGHSYMPDVVVSPGTTQEVSEIMKYANAHKIPVYPRGSGTNLSAGTAPLKGG